jgi:transposase
MYSPKVFNMALVHYLHFHRSLRKVSSIYGCSPSTLSRWVKKHAKAEEPRKKTSRKAKIEKIESEVAQFVSENPFQRLVDIMVHLRKSGTDISRSTVHRVLRRAKFTRKRVAAKYCPKYPTKEEAEKYLSTLKSDREVISIDESSVYLESRPIYGYSKKGTRLSKQMNKPLRGNRKTLILAISNKRGVIHHEIVKGSANAKIFSEFVKKIQAEENAFVLLDNVRFHHSKCVKDAASERKLSLVYTPPYQPDFNPVENAFSVIKSHTRKFDDSIKEALDLVTLGKTRAFFKHAISFIEDYISVLE